MLSFFFETPYPEAGAVISVFSERYRFLPKIEKTGAKALTGLLWKRIIFSLHLKAPYTNKMFRDQW